MIDFIHPKFIAVAQIVMSVSIIRFWIKWFRTEHNEPWLPVGYHEHERVFVYPDTVLSVLMIISAFSLFFDRPLGGSLSLVCGGMMLFLTVIDIAYFYQHGMFSMKRGGKENWGLILPLSLMSAVMILRFI